ncbi:MAG: translation initiation factor IF-2 subunit gamma [Nanoarchaeota archaeon]|nr:translation initiation factor IF-2 subunit gamma [Nanoarchaeota archaeon]MBU1320957.1 translation initiation factor IF-2 subunit gamma [Nanoarchaeota archaeon]MBU1598342.1 translation initiation factor IF-2 subunit gamma [Nanoarchaeota archaeon]MBU2441756.1 translation initiation factor IF-2 subunit gamma [Nanoarchaeota archaeon]
MTDEEKKTTKKKTTRKKTVKKTEPKEAKEKKPKKAPKKKVSKKKEEKEKIQEEKEDTPKKETETKVSEPSKTKFLSAKGKPLSISSKKKEIKPVIDVDEAVQPSINIGLVGHVDHGKTTLTEKLSGKWTDTHSEEIKRGITIRLGYADSVFRKCPECKGPDAFTVEKICKHHNVPTKFIRKVSFVDAPGHESLMATMLSGSTIMDGALLLIAANEPCPQPQTREHLMALKIAGIKNVIVIQNKIDLVSKERAMRNYDEIQAFLKGTDYEKVPIIPVSAQHGVNIDVLIQTIEEVIPTPKRDPNAIPLMLIARSFDINKPGISPMKMKGGVLGGAIVKGKLKVGDRIEIRPGRIVEEQNKIVAKPIFTTITGAMTGGTSVDELGPGGSVAIMTSLDPAIVHSDSLTSNLIGLPDQLPQIWYDLALEVHLLERVVGSQEDLEVDPIKINEALLLNVNGEVSIGFVNDLSKNTVKCKLKMPLCADVGDKVTLSRRIGTRYRLIGYALIKE